MFKSQLIKNFHKHFGINFGFGFRISLRLFVISVLIFLTINCLNFLSLLCAPIIQKLYTTSFRLQNGKTVDNFHVLTSLCKFSGACYGKRPENANLQTVDNLRLRHLTGGVKIELPHASQEKKKKQKEKNVLNQSF